MKNTKSLLLAFSIATCSAVSAFASNQPDSKDKEAAWKKVVIQMIAESPANGRPAKITTTNKERAEWVAKHAAKMKQECKIEKNGEKYMLVVSPAKPAQVASSK